MFEHCNSAIAARKAGYPEPGIDGPELYDMFKAPMDAWRTEANMDREDVLHTYRRQLHAKKVELVNVEEIKANPEIEPIYEYTPNESLASTGAKGLRDVLGLDKAKGLDLNMSGNVGLTPSTQEMLDSAYKQD